MDTLLFDLSAWSQIQITGVDRKSFLQSFCTNDINKLGSGAVCEVFIPDIKGKILGHLFVVAEDEHLTLLAVPGANETVAPHLTKYLLGVEAEVQDKTNDTGLLCLIGDNVADVVGEAVSLELNQGRKIALGGNSLLIVRVDITNFPTYLVSGSREEIEVAQQYLLEKGAPVGTDAHFERLRIEAGFPFAGVDISAANIAQEAARTDQTISFTKGCYLGQEPIARLDAMGHTNKELRGLVIEAESVSNGASVLAEEKEVGTITSVAQRGDGTSVGFAIVRAKFAKPGTSLVVTDAVGTYPATVFWPRLE
ncbi:CAF17-like 4Fe-4S cluster assembly/insertion protein YgfZ [Thalassoglobus polymorphus]|uniref:Aminomethyltransferase n=1 Tax=Thalassoglobus polymorphus TaxID=2527994 RepID=A0A517QL04_9PLAN|nr:glycine cleavage T C-terminal barrel domain-containing protein [Thalassoglobus polymorphus]QDT32217.1 Aminomethyltransferase [Thalassoglobus polymorphus]